MDKEGIKPVLESLIFASENAISFASLCNILEGEDRATVKAALNELISEYGGKNGGLFIEEVAGGYQFRTNPEHAPWLRRLFKMGAQKISKAAMETLAVIAYKQPVTRGEVETIRGVDSGAVLATLMDKRLIKITGRKEAPGRPVVYGTTKEFLETFDLKDLGCLPSLKDIQTLEELNAPQNTATKRLEEGLFSGLREGVPPDETETEPGVEGEPDRAAQAEPGELPEGTTPPDESEAEPGAEGEPDRAAQGEPEELPEGTTPPDETEPDGGAGAGEAAEGDSRRGDNVKKEG